MNQGRTVLSQVMDGVHQQQFHRCVERYGGEYKVQSFTCWEQFLAMSFAQLTYRESLRDIEACLNSRGSHLYHLGFQNPVARSTLADANERRDWRIYADLAQSLIRKAQRLYENEDLGFQLNEPPTLSIPPPSICASVFSPGLVSDAAKERSSCTPY